MPDPIFHLRDPRYYFTDDQITRILDRLVPELAAPEDADFFRGVLRLKAEVVTAAEFCAFVSTLITTPIDVHEFAGDAEASPPINGTSDRAQRNRVPSL